MDGGAATELEKTNVLCGVSQVVNNVVAASTTNDAMPLLLCSGMEDEEDFIFMFVAWLEQKKKKNFNLLF